MPFALAWIEENKIRKAFLIRYGVTRLPSDAALLAKAKGYLQQFDDPGNADLLAGLAISSWRLDQKDEATGYYKSLVESDDAWAKAETVVARGWPRSGPMEAVRAATLLKFPELVPKH